MRWTGGSPIPVSKLLLSDIWNASGKFKQMAMCDRSRPTLEIARQILLSKANPNQTSHLR